jgi:hypothetical protein
VIVASGERFVSQKRGTFDKARNAFGISFPGRDVLKHKVAKRYSYYTYTYPRTIRQ